MEPQPSAALRRIACPRCLAPMHGLQLPTHRPQPVAVDHCPDCRLVWFDALESVQLDGLGWVRLLRELEQGAARPLAAARAAQPACPECRTPLKAVRNRSRFGLFAALECPQRHGHLHSHSGLLAERGLVRPLGAAERRAIQHQGRPLQCLNCGGPAAAGDEHCSWCGTALVVLDLPRLAHALRLRLQGLGPSPQQPGRHVAWSCRGCGAALDPGRETACARCGHLVVALALPDMAPLLDAAEAELKAAADQAAQRRMAAPARRERRPEHNAGAHLPAAGARALMLHGWAPLLLLAGMALTLAGAAWADWHWTGRSSLQVLLAQRVGDDPAAAWGWVEAWRLLQPDDARGLRALRQGLMDLHLRQLAGDAWPATATVASTLRSTPGRGPGEAPARWSRILLRDLQLLPVGDAPILPTEALPSGSRWASVAPGIWVERDRRIDGLWLPTVRNVGNSPLLLRQPALRMVVSGGYGVDWRCQPLDAAHALVSPGQRQTLLCRTAHAVREHEAGWTTALHRIRAGEPPALTWADPGLTQAGGVDPLIDRLVADAARQSVPLDRFLRQHAGLRQGMPELAGSDTAASRAAASESMSQRWQALSGSRRQLIGLSALLLLFAGFCAVARRYGERRAAWALVLAALPLGLAFGRGQGAGWVLLAALSGGVALVLVLVFGFGFRLYSERVFRRYG